MGGEAHPVGRVVNICLVILIIASGLAFTKLLYKRLLHPVRSSWRQATPEAPCSSAAARRRCRSRRDATPSCTKGDFFGEMSLFERRRHKDAVVAGPICQIYVLDSEGLAR